MSPPPAPPQLLPPTLAGTRVPSPPPPPLPLANSCNRRCNRHPSRGGTLTGHIDYRVHRRRFGCPLRHVLRRRRLERIFGGPLRGRHGDGSGGNSSTGTVVAWAAVLLGAAGSPEEPRPKRVSWLRTVYGDRCRKTTGMTAHGCAYLPLAHVPPFVSELRPVHRLHGLGGNSVVPEPSTLYFGSSHQERSRLACNRLVSGRL